MFLLLRRPGPTHLGSQGLGGVQRRRPLISHLLQPTFPGASESSLFPPTRLTSAGFLKRVAWAALPWELVCGGGAQGLSTNTFLTPIPEAFSGSLTQFLEFSTSGFWSGRFDGAFPSGYPAGRAGGCLGVSRPRAFSTPLLSTYAPVLASPWTRGVRALYPNRTETALLVNWCVAFFKSPEWIPFGYFFLVEAPEAN